MKYKNILIIAIVFLLLSGCGDKDSSPEDIVELFLTNIFTSDYEERYTKFSDSNDPEATSPYYESLAAYTTEDCREKLTANRIPFSYDKLASDGNYQLEVKNIELTLDEKEQLYDFEVSFDVTGEGEPPFSTISGQVGIENEDEDVLINYLYIRG